MLEVKCVSGTINSARGDKRTNLGLITLFVDAIVGETKMVKRKRSGDDGKRGGGA